MTILYKAAATWINNSKNHNIHLMYNEQMNDFWCGFCLNIHNDQCLL